MVITLGLTSLGCQTTKEDVPAGAAQGPAELIAAGNAVEEAKADGAERTYPAEYRKLRMDYHAARGSLHDEGRPECVRRSKEVLASAQDLIRRLNQPMAKPAINQPPVANPPVQKKPRAVAEFSGPVSGAPKQLLPFDASGSSVPAGSKAVYWWDFGDGTTSKFTFPIATHRYVDEGKYTVELQLLVDGAVGGSASQTVEVRKPQQGKSLFIKVSPGSIALGNPDAKRLQPIIEKLRADPALVVTLWGTRYKTEHAGRGKKRAEMIADIITRNGISADRVVVDKEKIGAGTRIGVMVVTR